MSNSAHHPAHEVSQSKTVPPDSQVHAGELASLPDRFVAGLIDGLIVGVASSVLMVPVAMTGVLPFLLLPLMASLVAFGVFVGINFNLLKSKGQTVGKSIMNLQITRETGEAIDVQDVLVKRYSIFWLANSIPYIGFLVALANVALVFRQSRKAGHDEVAETKVVRC